MAANPPRSYWPQGEDGWIVLKLGPVDLHSGLGNTSAGNTVFRRHDAIPIPADLRVKKAFLTLAEDCVLTNPTAISARVRSIDMNANTNAQTIVAARDFAATDDDEAWTSIELTVADEGPVTGNSLIVLEMENNAAGDIALGITVTLWCRPVYS